ncbi:hypothetical protein TBR22_A33020 [Luteitalea sp. TBR-22]|nr:hypothetical protein TBR22_A33020 [Luteitalea sp. TBR-22]
MLRQRQPDPFEVLGQLRTVAGDLGDQLEDLQASAFVLHEQPRPQRPGREDTPDAERSDLLRRLEQGRGVVGQGRDSPARGLARADKAAL